MNLDEFRELSLDDMVSTYQEQVNEAGSTIRARYDQYIDLIYDRFFTMLDKMIWQKYRFVFLRMHLETSWAYDYDKTLISKTTSLSILYDANHDTFESDYEPLAKFILNLNTEKLNNEYLSVIFEELSKKFDPYLEKAYEEWSKAMAEYYYQLHYHYKECRSMDNFCDYPMDNPERYFLTHETIVLD